jgi:uncharacterized protein (DUF983 family)
MPRTNVSAWRGILYNLCPRCREGKIFRKSLFLFPAMYERCPVCALKFEREDGYFLGAMYVGYGLGLVAITGFGFLLWLLPHWSLVNATIGGVIIFLPFAPWLTLVARVLWIYLDQSLDPDLG